MLHHVRLPAEVIANMPTSLRVVARYGRHSYGRATASLRPLPNFLIIGAQKAGTTALFAYLRWHPTVMGPSWKEVSFFDRRYGGERSYARASPPGRGNGSSPAGAACGRSSERRARATSFTRSRRAASRRWSRTSG